MIQHSGQLFVTFCAVVRVDPTAVGPLPTLTPDPLAELSSEVKQIVGFDMYRALGFYDCLLVLIPPEKEGAKIP